MQIDFNEERYQLIDDFPQAPWSVGAIITLEELYDYTNRFRSTSNRKGLPAAYPNLFRLLKWFQYRTPEHLPKYVRYISEESQYFMKGDALKVGYWQYIYAPNIPSIECGWTAFIETQAIHAIKLLPITKEQYDKTVTEHKPSAGS